MIKSAFYYNAIHKTTILPLPNTYRVPRWLFLDGLYLLGSFRHFTLHTNQRLDIFELLVSRSPPSTDFLPERSGELYFTAQYISIWKLFWTYIIDLRWSTIDALLIWNLSIKRPWKNNSLPPKTECLIPLLTHFLVCFFSMPKKRIAKGPFNIRT